MLKKMEFLHGVFHSNNQELNPGVSNNANDDVYLEFILYYFSLL